MTESNKWTRFLPTKLEKWLTGEDRDDDVDAVPPASTPDPLLTHEPPGVEWTPGGDATIGEICPVCGTDYPEDAPADAVCAACGSERPSAALPAGIAPSPTQYLDPDVLLQPRRPCTACGGEVDIDGYCMTCGAKQASERDHFREEPARWVAGVCDRGIRHSRNEDAMALAAGQRQGERGVLVVCDGVSTSEDSDVASLAAAQAARDLLWGNQPKGLGTDESRSSAMSQTLVESAKAANAAVVAHTALDSANAASATYAAAVVSDGRLFYANLGDSRIYWLPDGGPATQLSVDDSVAQMRIEAGVPREEAENGEGAHSITKWLGRDSTDIVPRVGELEPEGPGWLLVCSDGLWNYASEPTTIAQVMKDAIVADPQPSSIVDVAERMVAWANEQGGRDNITVALARLGGLEMLSDAPEQSRATTSPSPSRMPAPVPQPAADEVVFEQPDWGPAGDVPPAAPDLATAPLGAPPRPVAADAAPAEPRTEPVPPTPTAAAAAPDGDPLADVPTRPVRRGVVAPEASKTPPASSADATPDTRPAIVEYPPTN